MPSPGIPHRPSNRGSGKSPASKPKRLDLGDPLGPHDTNTVREKVRKWQQQGGGVVIAPDVGASDEDEDKRSRESGVEPRQKRKDKDREDAGRIRTRGSEEEGKKKKVTSRSGGNAPKKRVISDAHWRKDRPPTGSPSPSPTKRTSRRDAEATYGYGNTKDLSERKKEKPTEKPLTGDGINVYPGPLRPPTASQSPMRSGDSGRSNSSIDYKELSYGSSEKKSTSRRKSTRREVRAKYVVNDFPYKSDHSRPHESSDAASFSGKETRMASPKMKAPTRTMKPKGDINTQAIDSKTKFSKKDLPPVQQSHGSKVEAWLSRTSDPFIDDDESYVEMPPPLKSSPRWKSMSTVKKDVDTDEKQSASEDQNTSRKDPHKRRKSFSGTDGKYHPKESNTVNNDPSETSPASLKRSKASKRPKSMEHRKMSMLRESVEEALKSSSSLDRPISSDGSEVSLTDRPPPLTLRRMFPGTGMHRLSTIASVDTLNTTTETAKEPEKHPNAASAALEGDDVSESEIRDQFDPYSMPGPGASSSKRKLATHADLMSVLSLPTGGSRSIRSARSIRTNRSRLATATVGDIMRELASDEAKYMRELRTLVGGVIPVLLTSVLSKTDSAIAAGLFRPNAKPNDDDNFTRPIVNMGVSLEKLKALHKKIPLDNPDGLLNWAQGAQKVYADYLSAWRLGFQDVVVNLAPPDPDEVSKGPNSDAQSLYAGMSQDENGDVIDGDGERVDVAFLLKRPLVRLKYLAKTFKGLNYIQSSPKASEIEKKYQSLVTDARHRANEERARLEDEAASATDACRARDIHTLKVLKDVEVNQNRRVRARDFFDLSFLHSTGQQIDCRSELLLRDNPTEHGPGGDLFICEVDSAGRWLLFPPIDHGRVSARNGDTKGEIVIMVRGVPEEGGNWYELLSLKTEDEQIGFEWVHMLGLSPVPPKINRSLSFVNRAKQKKQRPPIDLKRSESVLSTRSIIPSPTDIGMPIGERRFETKQTVEDDQATFVSNFQASRESVVSESSRGSINQQKPAIHGSSSPVTDTLVRPPRSLNEAMDMAGGTSPTTLKRSQAKRRSKYGPLSPISSGDARSPEGDVRGLDIAESKTRKRESELLARSVSPELKDFKTMKRSEKGAQRPIAEVTRLGRRSLSPVPSLDLPSMPRLRQKTPRITPPSSPVPVEDRSGSPKPKSPKQRNEIDDKLFLRSESSDQPVFTEDVPAPPPHRSPSPSRSKKSSSSAATPTFSPWARHRRTSSPLKHEYEPSTATASTESDTSTVERHTVYSSTETSDEELESNDLATPLPPTGSNRANKVSSPPSSPTLPDTTLAPSNSASQAPYKTVPSQPSKAEKTIASIYYWHDKGSWEALYPEECSIVVTPGLIEACEMGPAHSQPEPESDEGTPRQRPLIALELTPLVPIRRGTALDISIRSPPTSKSKLIFTGTNVMFRSRSPDECDKLYGLINQARINNPTYIALQNARDPYSNQPTSLSRYNSTRSTKGSGWFSWYGGLSKSSYRASSAPAPSVAGVTESSVGTMASAFSALKRFGAGSKMFSIARSTLTSRTGSRGGSLYSTSTRSGSNPSPAWQPNGRGQEASRFAPGGIGLTNAKIRLYCRESASKWRDMGAARLTILPASPATSPPGTSSNSIHNSAGAIENETSADGTTAMSPSHTPAAAPASRQLEKRILIHSKAHGQVLLDACLGESCFERVARTGIAVSVWEDFQGVAKEGGVVGGSFKIYMIQMKSEAETAYTFGLVGKLRY
ncbi:predicted protein [Uncinocarpus reesii 1704]|uniref:Uncharacterized protein n=1 Tax=Uncinocarpus reesii (strain UAMH 1704) TaxID=336963 RepID=C4JY32_UNCRE|nr:uncharacterized protein UREG_07083 [Uncinocarpus reesii 1704]EEP82218.1 predicted protein [Uncinocarpus reesii 1704]